jgi:hypothetical protein
MVFCILIENESDLCGLIGSEMVFYILIENESDLCGLIGSEMVFYILIENESDLCLIGSESDSFAEIGNEIEICPFAIDQIHYVLSVLKLNCNDVFSFY